MKPRRLGLISNGLRDPAATASLAVGRRLNFANRGGAVRSARAENEVIRLLTQVRDPALRWSVATNPSTPNVTTLHPTARFRRHILVFDNGIDCEIALTIRVEHHAFP